MKLRQVVVVGLSSLMAIEMVGCGLSGENKDPVEIVNQNYGDYYVDSVKYSGVKSRNYEGYFLSDGMSIVESLKLEDLDSLVFGWEWEILDKTYTGGEVEIPEEDQERLEKEAEEREAQEEAKKAEEEAARKEAEEKGEEYIPPEEESGEVNPDYGSCTSINEVLSLETILYPGQVLRVTPVFEYIPPEETEGDAEGDNVEVDGDVEDTSTGDSSTEGTNETTGETEESEEIPEPKSELLGYVEIVNYLDNKSTTVADCVNRMWYSVSFLNYDEVFKLSPESEDSFTTDMSLFEKLSETLGYPTSAWEKDMNAEEYVSGKREESIDFEFPDYTIEGTVTEDGSGGMTIKDICYIPSELWLEGEDFSGLRLLHATNDIEVVHDVLPTIEGEESE